MLTVDRLGLFGIVRSQLESLQQKHLLVLISSKSGARQREFDLDWRIISNPVASELLAEIRTRQCRFPTTYFG